MCVLSITTCTIFFTHGCNRKPRHRGVNVNKEFNIQDTTTKGKQTKHPVVISSLFKLANFVLIENQNLLERILERKNTLYTYFLEKPVAVILSCRYMLITGTEYRCDSGVCIDTWALTKCGLTGAVAVLKQQRTMEVPSGICYLVWGLPHCFHAEV